MEITVTKWDEMNEKLTAQVPNKFGMLFAQKLNLQKKGSNAGNKLFGPPGMNLGQHASTFIANGFQTDESEDESEENKA